jgi:hypothetical protein
MNKVSGGRNGYIAGRRANTTANIKCIRRAAFIDADTVSTLIDK